MNVFDVFSGFVPLLVLGLLTFGVVRLGRRAHGGGEIDPAALIRQIALYGLLYITMILTASGAIWAYNELTSTAIRSDNRALAQAMALIVLGLPVFTTLLAYVDRRLRSDEHERTSVAWSAYLTIASMTALIGTMVGGFEIISTTIDSRASAEFDGSSVILVLIWGAFFATHWFFLRPRHGLRGDLHLAAGSVVGLVPLVIGQAGLLAVLANRIYAELFDLPIRDLGDQSAPWVALFIIGSAVWIGIWLRNYESSPRTEAWYVTVLPMATLAGFVALLATSARLAYITAVWAVGETNGVSGARHFDEIPELLAIGVTGAVVWLYHRSLLTHEISRTNAVRSYDYLLMGASLITGVIGAVIVISSLLDDASTDQNLALAGITLLITGGFTWSRFASHVVAHQTGDEGLDELRSPIRRSYLYASLGAGGLAVLIAGIGSLEGIFEDILDSNLGYTTVVDQREQLGTVVIVAAVLWFHGLVLRSDQRRISSVMPPPPPPPAAHWPSRIIVVGSTPGSPLDVSAHPGSSVEYWHRTDDSTSAAISLDLRELDEELMSQDGEDVLVLLNGDTPTVIPFER